MNQISQTLKIFSKVSLSDLDKVRLMNRTDEKFCIHIAQLPAVLDAINTDYSVLEIDGDSIFKYDNVYFDTSEDRMYLSHQNGKRNRYKIRLRNYVKPDDTFLEVKFKNNKGRTNKERVERPDFQPVFTYDELTFIEQSSPYRGYQLEPRIRSHFSRFTLVDKQFSERITIDILPGFQNQEKEIVLNSLVIIEVKQSKAAKPSRIITILRQKKIMKQSFSKYCIGRALLDEKIKKNNFKPLLLKLKKENYY